jgi:putative ABC transport system substrate-binding protein
VEGRTIAIEYRWAEGKPERIPDLTADLVRLKVDVIVTAGEPGTPAAKQATSTIPIVFAAHADPVGAGLVASLARPGGNITGLSSMTAELGEKRLELLKEAFPKLSRVAVLRDPRQPLMDLRLTETAARALGLRLQVLEVRDINDLEAALAAAKQGRAGALMNLQSTFLFAHRARIVEAVAKARLPAMYHHREFVAVGGLMAYSPNFSDMYRRAAVYVDKIIKGAKPADLPVEQPTRFELVINVKTAKGLGLTIPQSVLVRADRVIQ